MAEVTLESLAAQLQEQAKTISTQNELIQGLQAKLVKDNAEEAKAPPAIPAEPVKIGKKSYKFLVAAFCLPGSDKKHLAEEVATDEELLKAIVKIDGQGILREQE